MAEKAESSQSVKAGGKTEDAGGKPAKTSQSEFNLDFGDIDIDQYLGGDADGKAESGPEAGAFDKLPTEIRSDPDKAYTESATVLDYR